MDDVLGFKQLIVLTVRRVSSINAVVSHIAKVFYLILCQEGFGGILLRKVYNYTEAVLQGSSYEIVF